MSKCIGLDMGYGFVKAHDGREGFVFPSVVGEGSAGGPMSFGFAKPALTEDIRIGIDGKTYYLGDLAIRHSRIAYRGLSATRSEGDDIKILFLGALSLFCHEPVNDFSVVTGLPPGRLHLENDLVSQLKGDFEVTRHNGNQKSTVSIRIDQMEVVPQPVGTYWSEVLDARGHLREDSELLQGKVGVIDIGFRTSDFATVVDGEYAPSWSRTVPLGIYTAYDEIAQELSSKHGIERETYALDESIISGQINISGQKVDITELRDRVFGDVATKLLVDVRSLWQLEEYDRVLLTGGGGHVLESYLRSLVPQAQLVRDPVAANARGYFAWAYHQRQPASAQHAESRPASGETTAAPAGEERTAAVHPIGTAPVSSTSHD